MQCYKELTPPTAVQHSIVLNFISHDTPTLVVAKGSLLQIFRFSSISAEVDAAQSNPLYHGPATGVDHVEALQDTFLGEAPLVKTDRGVHTKLVLVAEFPIAAHVCGLAKVRPAQNKYAGDCLLIALRDAKMTLVGWRAETHSMENISVHYYEQEELEGSPWEAPMADYETYLEADPQGRCAALKFGAKNLAILPFGAADGDVDMDDWDEDIDGPRPVKPVVASVEGEEEKKEGSHAKSYVVKLPQLDHTLLHTVHLTFLHGYREPTFSVISSTQSHSFALNRKDNISYRVFTLDLQQQASTPILSVEGLPSDLFRIVPLAGPMGGALLLGDNELIHIDQSGKPNGVAVNPYTRETTNYHLADQSDLKLKLEYCAVEQLGPNASELLLVLNDGRMALVVFRVEGRTVSGISIKMVPRENGGLILPGIASCMTQIGRNTMFVGSEDGDSHVIGWTRKQNSSGRRKSRMPDEDFDMDTGDLDLDEVDSDDDLYGESTSAPTTLATALAGASKEAPAELNFKIHDTLVSLAPIRSMTTAATVPASKLSKDVTAPLQLALATGRTRGGAMSLVNRGIQPRVISRFERPNTQGIWSIAVQKPVPKALQGDRGKMSAVGVDFDPAKQHDKFLIIGQKVDGKESSDESKVYSVTDTGYEPLEGTEFDPEAGLTLDVGVMGAHTRVVQVLRSEVRVYDGAFDLSQIVPMLDDETDSEPQIVSASFADRYLMLVRDDSSVFIAHMDSNCDLEEITSPGWLPGERVTAGCLYTDSRGVFGSTEEEPMVLAFLIMETGALKIFKMGELEKPVFEAEGLAQAPPVVEHANTGRRGFAQESVVEMMVADVGDRISHDTYLIMRNSYDDLILYAPVNLDPTKSMDLNKTLRFAKVPNPVFSKQQSDERRLSAPLRICPNINGYSTVFLPGESPSFLIKDSKAPPRILPLTGPPVLALAPFHTPGSDRAFIYHDSNGVTRIAQFPDHANYSLGIAVRKINLDMDVKQLTFHQPSQTLAVACTIKEEFELPKDDDYHKEWQRERDLPMKPLVEKTIIRLFDMVTWIEISKLELDQYEVVHAMKTLNLEVSEVTKERRQLITVGTSIPKGEDMAVRGRVYVFDVVSVIPEPDKPHTSRKLKLIAQEEIPRGAVTALSEIGTQGLMLLSQGQKCMVRGLKEDGSLLPVAFLDLNCYVTTAKSLTTTGLCILTDAFKGLWFVGSTEEPYRMQLFGKSASRLDVATADFLPDGDQLFLVAAGWDGEISILQYDPEDPKSLQGHLLLHRTSFAVSSNAPTHMQLLPRSTGSQPNPHVLLMASPSGMLAALEPLSESSYRRLLGLSVQLVNVLPQYAAANPRAWRLPAGERKVGIETGGGGRTIVDADVLRRWYHFPPVLRHTTLMRAGPPSPRPPISSHPPSSISLSCSKQTSILSDSVL